MGYINKKNPTMDISTVIAKNLSAWMAATPSLDTIKKLSDKSKVGFGTVQRAKNGDGNITVANLLSIARAFGRLPEDLLAEPRQAGVAEDRGSYNDTDRIRLAYAHADQESRYVVDIILGTETGEPPAVLRSAITTALLAAKREPSATKKTA